MPTKTRSKRQELHTENVQAARRFLAKFGARSLTHEMTPYEIQLYGTPANRLARLIANRFNVQTTWINDTLEIE